MKFKDNEDKISRVNSTIKKAEYYDDCNYIKLN